MSGPLARWAGVEVDGAPEVPELLAVLGERAEEACWAGVRLTAAEWEASSQAERSAWAAAGRRVAVMRAVWAGRSSQGDLAAAAVAAELDQGEAHDDLLMRATLRGVRGAFEDKP